MAAILDGKKLAQSMQAEIAAQVADRAAAGQPRPGLATVLVGDDPASHVYGRNHVTLEGSHVVIVGRSNIVGKPLALLLMQKWPGGNATVTVAHTGTRHLAALTRQADIVVVAIGRPKFLTADMIRPGAVVVDVGMNRVNGKLCGDADFDAVAQVAGAITPVPGGVGPMTITMLLHNTLTAAGG